MKNFFAFRTPEILLLDFLIIEWAKENIVKTYNSEETGGKGEIRISNGAITKYLSNSAVAKSDNKDVHLSVLKILPEVIKESIDAEQHFDYKKGEDGERRQENGENRDVVMHRLYGAVEIDGKIYRVKTTLKEFMYDKTEPKMPYSYEVTKIELLAGQNESTDKTALSRYSNNSITGAKLLQDVEKSHKKGEKLLDSSKIVDENGVLKKRKNAVYYYVKVLFVFNSGFGPNLYISHHTLVFLSLLPSPLENGHR